ncbi:MAG: hypothetical protein IT168_13720 [Bryobacterales bacterium]|nr:hypothetical protein [Bryobacterales bacterium]
MTPFLSRLLSRSARTPADAQAVLAQRWAELHRSASQVAFYQSETAAEWLRWAADPTQLERIPPIDLHEYYREVKQFRNPRLPNPGQAGLDAPWDPLPLVVAVAPWFPLQGRVQLMLEPSCQALMEAKPEAIAAPVSYLRGLAQAVIEKRLHLPTLRYGVIAWTGVSRPALTPPDRDLFWQTFQVPVFQQFRGFLGEPLAAECSCHEGMHVNAEYSIWHQRLDPSAELLLTSLTNHRYPVLRLGTGFRGRIDRSLCPCGRAEPRISELEPLA